MVLKNHVSAVTGVSFSSDGQTMLRFVLKLKWIVFACKGRECAPLIQFLGGRKGGGGGLVFEERL